MSDSDNSTTTSESTIYAAQTKSKKHKKRVRKDRSSPNEGGSSTHAKKCVLNVEYTDLFKQGLGKPEWI